MDPKREENAPGKDVSKAMGLERQRREFNLFRQGSVNVTGLSLKLKWKIAIFQGCAPVCVCVRMYLWWAKIEKLVKKKNKM